MAGFCAKCPGKTTLELVDNDDGSVTVCAEDYAVVTFTKGGRVFLHQDVPDNLGFDVDEGGEIELASNPDEDEEE